MPSDHEPVMEGTDGEVRTREDIWEMFTTSLLEHRDGADELLGIMVELGIKDLSDQKAFVAMSIEFRYLSQVSLGMTVNIVQLIHLAQKWGVPLETMKRMKVVLAPDAPETLREGL